MPTPRTHARNLGAMLMAETLGYKVNLTYTTGKGETNRRRGVKVLDVAKPTSKTDRAVIVTVKIDGDDSPKTLRSDRMINVRPA